MKRLAARDDEDNKIIAQIKANSLIMSADFCETCPKLSSCPSHGKVDYANLCKHVCSAAKKLSHLPLEIVHHCHLLMLRHCDVERHVASGRKNSRSFNQIEKENTGG